jgi:putative ABC transport system permease protein
VPPIKLTVIGVIDPSSDLASGVYVSRATAAPLGQLPDPEVYYFHLAPGVQVADAVTGLQVSFVEQGLTVSNLGDTLRVSQSVRTLLTRLVQGFMGLGLIAGIAALGMLGVQAVLERQRQLGTLRALGFTRWETRATLALESAITAVLGVTVGVLLGLLLAHSLVALLASDHPEVVFVVPWRQIALTVGVAWLGSALAIVVAAWQAGRVAPAEALRVG